MARTIIRTPLINNSSEEKKPARHAHVFVVSGDGRFDVCTCGETRERVERWS